MEKKRKRAMSGLSTSVISRKAADTLKIRLKTFDDKVCPGTRDKELLLPGVPRWD